MSDLESRTGSLSYSDREKWNQILFENANKNHLHQDNLRWTLSAGFAVFFLTSMAILNDPKYDANHITMHYLQYATMFIGTLWFFVLHSEGWYYNLYVAYLLDCEKRIAEHSDLVPIAEYSRLGRPGMKTVHPSYNVVLLLVVVANSAHLFQATNEDVGRFVGLTLAAAYMLFFSYVSIYSTIPQKLDALSW